MSRTKHRPKWRHSHREHVRKNFLAGGFQRPDYWDGCQVSNIRAKLKSALRREMDGG